MRCYKEAADGYISGIGTGPGGTEITQEEYNRILAAIHARPEPPEGYDYRLTEALEWELAERTAEEESTGQASAEDETADMRAALEVLGVSVDV